MDYFDLFRPLFVYTTHLVHNLGEPARLHVETNAIVEDMQRLIRTAFQNPLAAGEDFSEAWFAVRAWLAEKLAALPCGECLRDHLVESPADADREFFRRLHLLLAKPERRDLIKVYAACLESGYRGYYSRPGFAGELAGYRARCREALELSRKHEECVDAAAPVLRGRFAHAAAWLVPVGATMLLYCLYRLLLGGLYASVVG